MTETKTIKTVANNTTRVKYLTTCEDSMPPQNEIFQKILHFPSQKTKILWKKICLNFFFGK
jgi:hypothetical protein